MLSKGEQQWYSCFEGLSMAPCLARLQQGTARREDTVPRGQDPLVVGLGVWELQKLGLSVTMSTLFEPVSIGKLQLSNRFIRSATWDGTANPSGAVTDASVALYERLGRSGAGLIVTGYAFVSPLGQAVQGQYGAYRDDMIPGLRRLVEAVHRGGTKIALQIVHAGVRSDYLAQRGVTRLAVSHLPGEPAAHREMIETDIEKVISEFVAAALRGRDVGFDAVQLHGAHGYLLSQFLSPLYNHRTDAWGSAHNRRKFHLELVRRVRQALGTDFPLLIKFGVRDDREGGLSLSDGVETARLMAEEGIDAIEVSGGVGGSARPTTEGQPEFAYFRECAAAVKKAVAVSVAVVGGIRSLEMAQSIVASGDADLISMSRPFIREPGLIARWQTDSEKPAKCISCNKCLGIVWKGESLECGQEVV